VAFRNRDNNQMLKYYGTPLTPLKTFNEVMLGRRCLIPYPRPQDLKRALKICEGIIIDNGAFTIWRQNGLLEKGYFEWDDYYDFLVDIKNDIDFFFIPDVIDGTELENDRLIQEYQYINYHDRDEMKGVPIWHINESMERLDRLMGDFDFIAIGSAGEFAQLGTPQWEQRMDEAMRVLCDKEGYPKVKIHMLRCLDPKIFTRFPFYSGDSTALAQNHKRDGWRQIVDRIEKYDSPEKYEFRKFYETKCLFGEEI